MVAGELSTAPRLWNGLVNTPDVGIRSEVGRDSGFTTAKDEGDDLIAVTPDVEEQRKHAPGEGCVFWSATLAGTAHGKEINA
jgi:hypothetical protein